VPNTKSIRETILLIDDEDGVREMLKATLEGCGYRVLSANGGLEALELCEHFAGDVDLLLTDVVMPNASGLDLAGYLAVKYPLIKILRMSGFTELMLRECGLYPHSLFLQKPFGREELLHKVEEALRQETTF
jgi:CheY-like chemotaxis protein